MTKIEKMIAIQKIKMDNAKMLMWAGTHEGNFKLSEIQLDAILDRRLGMVKEYIDFNNDLIKEIRNELENEK